MRAKHLKGWLAATRKKEREEAATNQENPTEGMTTVGPDDTGGEGTEESRETTPTEASNWERVVDLVHTAFGEGRLAEEKTWQAVVMIPKGKMTILNLRLTDSITFQDSLHIFRAGCGTDTATLEAKLLHQLTALREEVLYMIFLDLHKAYERLYIPR